MGLCWQNYVIGRQNWGPIKLVCFLEITTRCWPILPPKYFIKLKRSSIAKHYACVPTHIDLTDENLQFERTNLWDSFLIQWMNEQTRKPLNIFFITSFEVNNYVSSHFNHYVCMSDCERRKKTGAALLCQMIEYKMHSDSMEYWEPCWNVLNQYWVQFVFYHFIKIQGDKSRWRWRKI